MIPGVIGEMINNGFLRILVYNTALLLVLVFAFNQFYSNLSVISRWKQVVAGILLGLIGIAIIETHWEYVSGIVFDTRTLLMGVTGLFFGGLPTVLALMIILSYRIYLGGAGLLMGIATILEAALIGLIWRQFRKHKLSEISAAELYLFGLMIHGIMLLATWFLPNDIRMGVLANTWIPVIVIYPLVTMFLGMFFVGGIRLELAEEASKKGEIFFKESQRAAYIGSYNADFVKDSWESSEVLDEIFGIDRNYVRSTKGWLDLVAPDDKEMMEKYLQKEVLTKHQPFNKEYRIQRPSDGKIKWVLGLGKTELNTSGKVISMIGTIQDITVKKDAEMKLISLNQKILIEKQRTEAILRDMGDAVFVTDKEKNIAMVNKAMEKLFGMDQKHMVGKSVDEILTLYYESSGNKPLDLLETVFEKKKPAKPVETLVLNRKGGDKIFVDGVGSPIVDENNNLEGTVWIFRDVTKEKEVDKLKTDFVSLASHQLRTPLTGIKWFVELLQESPVKISEEKKLDYIQKIGISNNRMIDLVNDLIGTSKAESGRLGMVIGKHQVKELLQLAIEQQGRIFADKKVAISGMESIPGNLEVEVDMVQIAQVLGNLLNNAASYSEAKSKIEIKVKKTGKKVTIAVKDQGVGIPEAQQAKMFNKFFRADNVAQKIPGSGLGLYVARSMVENHGGKIWFESEEGKGTTFYVELPIQQNWI